MTVYQAFMNHYFARQDPGPEPSSTAASGPAALSRLAGEYRSDRYSHRSLAKVEALLFPTITVTVTGQGRVHTCNVPGYPTGLPEADWVQAGPLLFREEHGARTLAFRADVSGEVNWMFLGTFPIVAFERVHAVDSRIVHLTLARCTLTLSGLTVVFWPAAALVRRRYLVTPNPAERMPGPARWTLWIACALVIVFAVILVLTWRVAVGVPTLLKVGLALQMLSAALAVVAAVAAAASWWAGWARWWGRLAYTIVVLGLLTWVWQTHTWNLLGFRY